MFRVFLFVSSLLLLTTSNSFSSNYSPTSPFSTSGAVVASVTIENKGIYNLATSIQFLRKPQDNKIFGTDEYKDMINRLSVEARGVMLQKILEAKPMKLSDFAALKNNIEEEIRTLIDKRKQIYGIASTEVVFSIGTFYLIDPIKH